MEGVSFRTMQCDNESMTHFEYDIPLPNCMCAFCKQSIQPPTTVKASDITTQTESDFNKDRNNELFLLDEEWSLKEDEVLRNCEEVDDKRVDEIKCKVQELLRVHSTRVAKSKCIKRRNLTCSVNRRSTVTTQDPLKVNHSESDKGLNKACRICTQLSIWMTQ